MLCSEHKMRIRWMPEAEDARPRGLPESRPLHPQRAGRKKLSARETEVLSLVASGRSAREIAQLLSITSRTVDEHVQAGVRKLGAGNRTNAVAIALWPQLPMHVLASLRS